MSQPTPYVLKAIDVINKIANEPFDNAALVVTVVPPSVADKFDPRTFRPTSGYPVVDIGFSSHGPECLTMGMIASNPWHTGSPRQIKRVTDLRKELKADADCGGASEQRWLEVYVSPGDAMEITNRIDQGSGYLDVQMYPVIGVCRFKDKSFGRIVMLVAVLVGPATKHLADLTPKELTDNQSTSP